MAWEAVMCNDCGIEYKVDLRGPVKDREWKLQNTKWICNDCQEKRNNIKYQAAIDYASQNDMASLEGTEKQIKWAEVIRMNIIEEVKHIAVEKIIDKTFFLFSIYGFTEGFSRREKKQVFASCKEVLYKKAIIELSEISSASFWIDNRKSDYSEIIGKIMGLIYKGQTEADVKSEKLKVNQIEEEKKVNNTIVNPSAITTHVVEVQAKPSNEIEINYTAGYDKALANLLYKYNYKWTKEGWIKKHQNYNGTTENITAEILSVIYEAGYNIRCNQKNIREKSLSGSFSREKTKIVACRKSGKYSGWFVIIWNKVKDEDYYSTAKTITGSKYDNSNIIVPPESWIEVKKFAENNDFFMTESAEKAYNTQWKLNNQEKNSGQYQKKSRSAALELNEVSTSLNIATEFKRDIEI